MFYFPEIEIEKNTTFKVVLKSIKTPGIIPKNFLYCLFGKAIAILNHL